MVRVDISQIIDHVGGIQPFSVVVASQDIGENEPWVQEDISVSGQIVNVGTVFRLTGTITANADLECCRCLQAFERAVSFEFEIQNDVSKQVVVCSASQILEDWRAQKKAAGDARCVCQ